jgi:hypothetical protein
MSEQSDDFYEDDEPVEQVLNAFEQGSGGVTSPPTAGTFLAWIPGVSADRRSVLVQV